MPIHPREIIQVCAMRLHGLVIAMLIAILGIFAACLRPSIGHMNLLFEPHAITIARNPNLDFVERLRALIPMLKEEVAPVIEQLMQPHEFQHRRW